MSRRSALGALVASVALAATACGGGTQNSAGTDPNSVSGTITWWDTSAASTESPAFKDLVAKFEQKYPKIHVNYVNVPFDGSDDKFKTAAQAGNGAPDVMRADVGWTPTFAALGYLQPLDGTPALADDGDFLPVPYASAKYQGKTYGVPEVTDTLALLYNKDLFAKAGITSVPRTWDEVKTAAQQLEQKVPGTTGVFVNADSYFLLPFLYGEGGDVVDTQAKKITLDSDKMAAAITTAKSLAQPGIGATDTSSNKYTNMNNGFKSGTIGMVLNGPWAVKEYLSGSAFANPDNLGVAPVPAGPAGQGGPVGGHNLVVYAGSPNIAASELFVQFMTSAESQAYIASKNNTMPTRKSVYAMPEVAGNKQIAAFQAPLDGSKPRPAAPGAGDLYDMFTPYYQKILGNQASLQDALAQAQQKAKGAVPGFQS
ncbi:extracellular solute-binding protein [Amycolatopsis cynarae]|uniref:Extracellular solute-binding protein n=1 Tax=Amycolatopsis cynarae TaxID=2995223 RepID=A0ABY7BE19_9PSEU|nr:extracellular solute-binding protein [Amycolatopsis sp. HUAS 11-8]WAL69669.1 extracellular solute-binding protein [Amycolatopsis sp. HUAS 11-8]